MLKTQVPGEVGERTLAVYKKSSYQTAYNRLADIADMHKQNVRPGLYNVSAQVAITSNEGLQRWWLERWECE